MQFDKYDMKYLLLSVTTVAGLFAADLSLAQDGSGDLRVYEDDLLAPWHHTTLSTSVALVSTEQQSGGTASMKIETTAPWGWVSMIYGPWNAPELDPAPYEYVEFAIYPTERATSVGVFFENSDNQDFPKIAVGTFNANTWTVVSIPVSELNPGGYTVKRLFIQDFSGETKTYYIDDLRFVAEGEGAPSAPALMSPANFATGISQTPDLMWNSVDNADAYRVQLAADNAFHSTVVNQSGISGTSYSIGQELNPNTTYFWRVRASNSAGDGDWSAVWQFTTGSPGEPGINVISPQGDEILVGGEPYTIRWEYREVESVGIHYSLDGGDSWVEIVPVTGASEGQFNWVVPRQLSRQAVVRVRDESNPQVYDLSERFGIYTSTVRLHEQFQFPDPGSPSSYRMIGLPGRPNIHLADVMTGEAGEEWRAYHDSGVSEEYLIEYDGSDIFRFSPGRAFWVISRNSISIDTEYEAVPLSTANTYSIPLQSGWNMISNPFGISIPWEDIQAINDLSDPIWGFDGSYEESPRFEPYRGYYFFNRHDLSELTIPYLSDHTGDQDLRITATGPTTTNTTANPVSGTKIEKTDERTLMLSVFSEGERRASVTAGSAVGPHGGDRTVHFAPPGDFAGFRLSIVDEKNEYRYKWLSSDQRRTLGEGQIFPVELSSPSNNRFELTADGIEAFPEYYEIRLIDERNEKSYDLRKTDTIPFSNRQSQYSFKLVIGRSTFIENRDSLFVSQEYDLSQNYPNPFNPATVIRYHLPVSSEVRLDVFDLLGRRVAVLVDGQKNAGTHRVSFDASSLSSGIYFYRLEAGDFTGIRKMILMK